MTTRDTLAAERVAVVRDIRIPTDDPGVTLSADLVRPVGIDAVPVLVTVLPYRKDATWGILDGGTHRWYATRGYASLLVDFRGIGSSGGRPRPPFDASEVEDGVLAVEWAAAQPWCDGTIGMWGHSYGALMAMRVACRAPSPLKAILPLMGLLDPERDFTHPRGVRGGVHPAMWGVQALLNQLLPPLHDYGAADAQRRWSERLRDHEPWLVDLARSGPGDPVWRTRGVDASAVEVPTFCVAGWRDIFCDATFRAYEQITAPKKLLAGPWMHTMPDVAPSHPVDIRALSLRWWDHWLRGVDDGVMDEPAVTLLRQGDDPGWRRFPSWPPPGADLRFGTGADTTLAPGGARAARGSVISGRKPDPTAGVLAGQWGPAADGSGLPPDEHDDDMRCLTCTSEPIAEDVVIGGRPVVTVHLAPTAGRTPPHLVVRLADVDRLGRSRLVTSGVVAAPGWSCVVRLTPTYYRVPAGHRLRVVVGDADFPQLWPTARPVDQGDVLGLSGVELVLPATGADGGTEVVVPPPAPAGPAPGIGPHRRPSWSCTRDLVDDGVEMTLGDELVAATPCRAHVLEIRTAVSASVAAARPAATHVRTTSCATVRLASDELVVARAHVDVTGTAATVTGEVDVDGRRTFSRRWDVALPEPTDRR